MQKAHEEASGLRLVQLVTTRTIAYEGLRPCKLKTNIEMEIQSEIYCLHQGCSYHCVHILSIVYVDLFSDLEGHLEITLDY